MKHLLPILLCAACSGEPFDSSLFSADAQDGGGDALTMELPPDPAGVVAHRRSDATASPPDGEPSAPDAAPEEGSGGLAAGGSGGATGGTGGAMVGGAGGALSMGGPPDGGAPPVPDGGAPPVPDGGALSVPDGGATPTPDACAPVTHDNGIGQSWEDCVPLYTYNIEQAMKACRASGAEACIQNARCGVGEVQGWNNNITTFVAEWGYEGFAAGLVAPNYDLCGAPSTRWN